MLTAQPFDIVKIRLQTLEATSSSDTIRYKGAWDCLTSIIKKEGFLSLYKGSLSPLIGVGSISALHFFSYQKFKHFLDVSNLFS